MRFCYIKPLGNFVSLIMPNIIIFLLIILYSVTATAEPIADLPEPVTNNAVALVTVDSADYLLSFMGMGQNKNYQAIHNRSWAIEISKADAQWQQLPPVPHISDLSGRLAAIAVGV